MGLNRQNIWATENRFIKMCGGWSGNAHSGEDDGKEFFRMIEYRIRAVVSIEMGSAMRFEAVVSKECVHRILRRASGTEALDDTFQA